MKIENIYLGYDQGTSGLRRNNGSDKVWCDMEHYGHEAPKSQNLVGFKSSTKRFEQPDDLNLASNQSLLVSNNGQL